ncbi:TPA: hypothetical protein N0F65_000248 [Lagenidium giganteum]|uniref:FYVE-type domain-containing protein n=1 Tax=Lagenidium giganteum TaxID=4803 RepID=A0AAV2Z6N8_9STRA|nr:TPA: hypothetical protein N0F65_000248 [Lagenidium giganteum]
MKRSMSRVNDFVRPVHLTDAEYERLFILAESLVEDVMWQYQGHHVKQRGVMDPTKWKLIKEKQQLSCYRQQRQDRHTVPAALTIGQMPGNVEDVMYGLVNTNKQDMEIQGVYTDGDLVDCRVLATIASPTPLDPFRTITIKWALRNHHSHGIYRFRDFVYLESTGMSTTLEGQRIGYHLQHSIPVASVGELPSHLKIIRGYSSVCYLFRQHRKDSLDCYFKGSMDLQGGVRDKIAISVAADLLMATAEQSIRCALMKKLSFSLRTASPTSNSTSHESLRRSRISKKNRDRSNDCAVCQRHLRPFMGKTQCELCCLNVCGRCSVVKKVFMLDKKCRMSPRRTDFCKACVMTTNTTSALWIASKEVQFQQETINKSKPRSSADGSGRRTEMSSFCSSRTQCMQSGMNPLVPSNTSISECDDLDAVPVIEDDSSPVVEAEECPMIGMACENDEDIDYVF